jgi:hypothetical protein
MSITAASLKEWIFTHASIVFEFLALMPRAVAFAGVTIRLSAPLKSRKGAGGSSSAVAGIVERKAEMMLTPVKSSLDERFISLGWVIMVSGCGFVTEEIGNTDEASGCRHSSPVV